jgi:hypothetical protein
MFRQMISDALNRRRTPRPAPPCEAAVIEVEVERTISMLSNPVQERARRHQLPVHRLFALRALKVDREMSIQAVLARAVDAGELEPVLRACWRRSRRG